MERFLFVLLTNLCAEQVVDSTCPPRQDTSPLPWQVLQVRARECSPAVPPKKHSFGFFLFLLLRSLVPLSPPQVTVQSVKGPQSDHNPWGTARTGVLGTVRTRREITHRWEKGGKYPHPTPGHPKKCSPPDILGHGGWWQEGGRNRSGRGGT